MRHSAAKVIPDTPLIDERFLMPEFPEPSAFEVTGGERLETVSRAGMGHDQSDELVGRSTRRQSAVSSVSKSRSWPRWLIALTLLFGAGFCGLQASLPQRMNALLLAVATPARPHDAEASIPAGLQLIPVDDLDPDDDEFLWQDENESTENDGATSASGWRMKSVAEFEPGDTILAFNHETGKPEQRKVVRKFERKSDHLRLLEVRSQDGKTQTIKTTDEHPFWLIATGKYVAAAKLQVGDEFRSPTGTALAVVGTKREAHPEVVPVYNVEVEGLHNYFVAATKDAEPLLAHNTCSVGDLRKMSEKADGRKAWVKYQNGAENAVKNQAPALNYNNKGFGGRDYVKFDGYRTNKAGDVTHMIDRKMSVTAFSKSERQARKQAAALAQNGLKGIWEVPTEAAKRTADNLLKKWKIKGIDVEVVSP